MDPSRIETIEASLLECITAYGTCLVAYSGGVDSAVVAMACYRALAHKAVAATGISPAVSADELQTARRVANQIGIEHIELPTNESSSPDYVANGPSRCFHCKTELYRVLDIFAKSRGLATIANGTNTDDTDDYRPGLKAAEQAQVRSPLVECGIDKHGVRQLAEYWQLEVWNKPASPCLASRVAYGQEVTPERLKMIEQAERCLKMLAITDCRVRYHAGDLARIEVPRHEIETLCEPLVRDWLQQEFTNIGFKYVTLDLQGFRSGSLNTDLPVLPPTNRRSSLLAEEA